MILADPWGYSVIPPGIERGEIVSPSGRNVPWWIILLFKFVRLFNPLALFRVCGRLSNRFMKRVRSDLFAPFDILWENEEDNLAPDYLYHANLHTPRYILYCLLFYLDINLCTA